MQMSDYLEFETIELCLQQLASELLDLDVEGRIIWDMMLQLEHDEHFLNSVQMLLVILDRLRKEKLPG